ncbi:MULTISPECIES: WD40 repeat domain-containing serine/threonine-protein kinase [unclassified Moorena]|uniref:WD40 repeat domain-containing serine/threonine-protein kinase n=1 Tax=unclassified Moorena TaxID=2683338 RepID=UPI0013CB993E|nr:MULTISPECIES: WD40 repeat domain-containing serine/threonine-protein kinase [unclassified Moorena]NEO19019.1 protein kinase [Moorena sp. SIO4A5]NEQ56361.1 protein kinase [Moorena sp. SIO4A1]
MSYCLNPNCPKPYNPDGNKFCQTCGTKLLLGQQYRPIKLIAAGGFGRTLLAIDEGKASKSYCVIKQFYPQGNNHPTKAARLFHQEALRLEQLGKHPQIPELFAHFEQDHHWYIVQEFIHGENLAQELAATEPFRESQIRRLLSQLLPVLHFIHQGKVIHRDIKPENIIRRRILRPSARQEVITPPDLVLVDFGAAKYATATTLAKTGTTIGSAGYAAPEQIFGKAVFASDIYSLGVTCIHLLTQTQPFNLYDPMENGFVWRDFLVNNPVSRQLSRILDKMIQSSIKLRYQSAIAVMDDLGITQETEAGLTWEPFHRNQLTPQSTGKTNLKTNSRPPRGNPRIIVFAATTLKGHSDEIYSVAFSPDGRTLASGCRDKTIKLWELKTAWEILTFGGWFSKHSAEVRAVAFSPKGRSLASGSADHTIKLWNVRTGKEMFTFTGHSGEVNSIAFHPQGYHLASGSSDGTIKLWDVRSLTQLTTLTGHSSWIHSVAFRPDGKILASGSADATIKLWSALSGQEMHTFEGHSDQVLAIAFTPNGQTLASASADGTIKLWDIGTAQEITTLNGHLGWVYAIAFDRSGQILASGSADTTIKLWDVDTTQEIGTLNGHSDTIHALAFGPNNRTLASGSFDNTIKIWR